MHCVQCGYVNPPGTRFCSGCGAALAGTPGYIGAPAAVLPSGAVGYADFGTRFVAYLIDAFIIGIFATIVIGIAVAVVIALAGGTAALQNMANQRGEGIETAMGGALAGIIGLGILVIWAVMFGGILLYYAMQESSAQQATIGKRVMGLKVTDMNGQRVTFSRAAGRFLGKMLSGMCFGLGYFVALFSERKQTLHDILAGCLVLRK